MNPWLKNINYAVSALLPLLVFVGCGELGLEPGGPDAKGDAASVYAVFKRQFDAGAELLSFGGNGDGTYRAVFSDETYDFDGGRVPVVICRTTEWPAVVPGRDGVWYVAGESTGVAVLGPNDGGEEVVMLMYDTDDQALFVRLSTGRMFFFHKGRIADVGCFRFEMSLNPSLTEEIICKVGAGVVTGEAANTLPSLELIATVAFRGSSLTCDDRTFQSSVSVVDYSKERTLRFGTPSRTYTVRITSPPRPIPVLRISTSGRAVQRDNYIDAEMTVEDPDLLFGNVEREVLGMEIKGRGNSTWDMPKQPYKLKLAEKRRLLGMSNDKHWVLMANYSDKSLLRNELAFEISRQLGMSWSPRSRPVELYLNGNYRGQYMLTEHIRVSPERVNIETVGPSDNEGNALTGGYFLWVDDRALNEKGQPGFRTPRNLPVTFEEPETLTPQQSAYIEKCVRDAELAIYDRSFTDYSEIIDIGSFIQYFIVQEIAKNVDGDMRLSTYMWKPYLGKLGFPCVWDFDIAFGNCDYNSSGNGPTGWHIRNAIWFRQLFRNPEFVARATEEWRSFYAKRAEVEAYIRRYAALIDDAQRRNFERWRILGVYVWPNYNAQSRTTYRQEVDYLLWFYNERVEWMNREIETGRLRNY